jgi:DNA-binding transcriptional LysR family regulator
VIDLRSIKVFLAVCDSRSFTVAAKRLQKTQSAVSQAVRQLEEDLGVVLVNRTSRSVTLTPAGELFHTRAAALLEDATGLVALMREHDHSRLTELRVGMVESFANAVGPLLIRSMLNEAINLALWSDITPNLEAALNDRRYDIVVVNDPLDQDANVTRFILLREPYVLLLPRDAHWEGSADDLVSLARGLPVVRYHAPSFMASRIDARFHRMNVQVSRRVSVDTTDKLLAMVAAGIGWSVSTPLALLRAPGLASTVRIVPFPGERFDRELFMLSRRGEIDYLTRRLAVTSREVLSTLVAEGIGPLVPMLRDEIVVPDLNATA